MSNRAGNKDFAEPPPSILIAWRLGHWSARFEDSPQVTYGGDTPTLVVDRLFQQWQNERFLKAARLFTEWQNERFTRAMKRVEINES
jgi:hypothetical protein